MSRVKAILLIGPTGSGKTPLGDALERKGYSGKQYRHFDFGAKLRGALSGRSNLLTDLDRLYLHGIVESGNVLDESHFHLAEKIFKAFALHVDGAITVLNGLPRHETQARAMAAHADVRRVVELKASDEIIFARLAADPAGDRSGRSDDSADLVRRKISLYYERTQPMLDWYAGEGVPIARIQVEVKDGAAELLKKFGEIK